MIESVDDIFQAFGGTSATALALGVAQSAASEMRRRKSIPVRYWPKLVAAAAESGIVLNNDLLVRIHAGETTAAPRVREPAE